MQRGGNAIDAALATAIALTVVEPNNNGIGSDAFAIVWDGESLDGLNASGHSPASLTREKFGDAKRMPRHGWDAVTVPGAVSAWVELSSRYGNLPFSDLFEDAVRYAHDGYPVGYKTGYYWQFAARTFKDFPAFQETFTLGGRPPAIGEMMRLPDHAATLTEIAETGGESFYRGRLAEAMAADAAKHDACMTTEDLAGHTPEWVGTLSVPFHGYELHEIPPSGQGLMALIGCGVLSRLGIEGYALDSADSVHLQIEATRIAYAQIERHLADIRYMTIAPSEFLSEAFLSEAAANVQLSTANPTPTTLGASPDTVYLTAADQDGRMISMIQSNYMGFGSGIVVPGTGISLQNRGAGFTLESGHPNEVAGGKRPYHTIIPGFVTKDDQPLMSFGVMGGHMQAQGHLQMMVRVCLFGQNPQAASDAPRWHLIEDGRVALEDGFDPAVAAELERRGHTVVRENPEHLFGGAQLIYRMDGSGHYCGGSDHRKEGLAIGF